MTSNFVTYCDAIAAELKTTVTGLTTATAPTLVTHLYTPWDPEEHAADKHRHLAVWPSATAINPIPIAAEVHELENIFVIQVWENAKEGSRSRRDESAAAAFFQLHDDILARLYKIVNETLGSSQQAWYVGTELPEVIDQVHWFRIGIRVAYTIGFN